jgi:hypothetical protein
MGALERAPAADGVGRVLRPPPIPSPRLKQLIGETPIDRVEVLSLYRKNVTDDDLKEIGKLYHLKVLCLAGNAVTDQGLRHLATLSELQELDLSRTKVTEAGLAILPRMKRLAIVRLNDLPLPDAAVAHLAIIPRLRILSIRNSGIARGEIAKLRNKHVLVNDGPIEWEVWGVDSPGESPLGRR